MTCREMHGRFDAREKDDIMILGTAFDEHEASLADHTIEDINGREMSINALQLFTARTEGRSYPRWVYAA